MTLDRSELVSERRRLERVVIAAKEQLAEVADSVERRKESVITTRRSMWENLSSVMRDTGDRVSTAQGLALLTREQEDYVLLRGLVHRLEKLVDSPYFGRIDFKSQSTGDISRIYIGLASLIDHEVHEQLVHDWRAPISGMFYDFELGRAHYEVDGVAVNGEILLKRQYKIERGRLIYAFDTDLRIGDEILQEVLSKSTDGRMRNIVATIQREQNKIIRDKIGKVLLVNGPAGSGKTSVALHRVAYLLFKYRETAKADNIVIFSPNRIFNDYISDVLPELGEENMLQTTFHEYADKLLESKMTVEDMSAQMEYLLTEKDDPYYDIRISGIKYKVSDDFIDVLKRYINYMSTEGIKFCDINAMGETVVTGDILDELYSVKYRYLPLSRRLVKLRRRVWYLLKPYERKRYAEIVEEVKKDPDNLHTTDEEIGRLSRERLRAEFEPVKSLVNKRTNLDFLELYKKLFRDPELHRKMSGKGSEPECLEAICKNTIELFSRGSIPFEDVAPLTYFKGTLEGIKDLRAIKHVIVDEAQDYSLLHYEIIKQLFPRSGVTALGDRNQSIHPYMRAGYDNIERILGEERTTQLRLTKSYRSSEEISMFTRSMLKNEDTSEYIRREGEKPELIRVSDKSELAVMIKDDIKRLISAGNKSVAVICRTMDEAIAAYRDFKDDCHIHLITEDAVAFESGVVMLPSYLSKGLEFDAVIVYNAGKSTYMEETERKLLYTVCTRALHHLHIYYEEELSPLMEGINPDLYVLKQ